MNDIKIYNKADGEYVIDILGDIGEDWFGEGENTKQAINQKVKEITSLNADRVIVNISSLGGSVDHGLAIHDALRSLDAEVITNVTGLTASAATIIAQAGDTRRMSDNALYLIHRAWAFVRGNVEDMMEAATLLEKIDERIVNMYKKRSGKDEDAIKEAMAKDQFLSPEEAYDLGLIDEIYEPEMKAAASVTKKHAEVVAMISKKASEQILGLVPDQEESDQVIPSGEQKQEESTNVEAQALDSERERLNAKLQLLNLNYNRIKR